MKKVILFASLMVLGVSFLHAQEIKSADLIKFKDLVHDFGKIKQSVPVTFEFSFTNISDKAVVIESATASCGCTTPVKPEGAIPKGKSEKLKAGYNAAAAGPFNKTIYVKVAGATAPLELKITGEVLTADAYSKYEAEKGAKPAKSGK
jgi:hypothetical protein